MKFLSFLCEVKRKKSNQRSLSVLWQFIRKFNRKCLFSEFYINLVLFKLLENLIPAIHSRFLECLLPGQN